MELLLIEISPPVDCTSNSELGDDVESECYSVSGSVTAFFQDASKLSELADTSLLKDIQDGAGKGAYIDNDVLEVVFIGMVTRSSPVSTGRKSMAQAEKGSSNRSEGNIIPSGPVQDQSSVRVGRNSMASAPEGLLSAESNSVASAQNGSSLNAEANSMASGQDSSSVSMASGQHSSSLSAEGNSMASVQGSSLATSAEGNTMASAKDSSSESEGGNSMALVHDASSVSGESNSIAAEQDGNTVSAGGEAAHLDRVEGCRLADDRGRRLQRCSHC